ncbi:TPA: KilA-N domain-containing protein [Escherichia coli]
MNNLMVIDGIEVRRDAYGRYSLNDLHRAAGGEQKNRPKYWISNKQTCELIEQLFTEGGIPPLEQNQPVSVINGGNNQGTYVCKELVYAYAMWISPSFHLKVIRTFDMVTSAPEKLSGQAADKMQAGVILLDFMRRELNLSNSSVLGACQKLQEAVGLPNLAPRYAIDAPADAHDGSSRPTLSLRDRTILKITKERPRAFAFFSVFNTLKINTIRNSVKFVCVIVSQPCPKMSQNRHFCPIHAPSKFHNRQVVYS